MQSATARAVQSVKAITTSVQSIEGLSAAIATAIEEQTATTAEIARNVSETSRRGAGSRRAHRPCLAGSQRHRRACRRYQRDLGPGRNQHRGIKGRLGSRRPHFHQDVERRRKPRYEIGRPAKVASGAHKLDLTVANISEGGALLTGDVGHLRETRKISLMIQGVSTPIDGYVLSIRKNTAHVKFDLSARSAARFAAQFGQLVAGLAPLAEAA